jgi:hypothetical protein
MRYLDALSALVHGSNLNTDQRKSILDAFTLEHGSDEEKKAVKEADPAFAKAQAEKAAFDKAVADRVAAIQAEAEARKQADAQSASVEAAAQQQAGS